MRPGADSIPIRNGGGKTGNKYFAGSVLYSMKRQILLSVFLLIFAAACTARNRRPASGPGAAIPAIEKDYGAKIVYTTDRSVDMEPLKSHCDSISGDFKACGTICPPGTDICAQICAYTCENIPSETRGMDAED